MTKWLVWQLGIEDMLVAVCYLALKKDLPRFIYWMAAGIINIATIYMVTK